MKSFRTTLDALRRSLVVKATLLVLLLIISAVIPNSFNAYADLPCNNTIASLQDSSYRGPIFIDSYWTDQSASSSGTNLVKKEVGPGDGPSTLAIVLVNRSPYDIINVQGALNLPSGFAPTGIGGDPSVDNVFKTSLRTGQTNPVIATYDNTVTAGSTFTLYFNIDVSKDAKVGLHPTPLVVNYYKASDFQFCSSAQLTVPFNLPGRVILDAVTSTPNLIPNQNNKLMISLVNKGSADATGVVATIVNLGDSNSRGSGGGGGSIILQSSTVQLVNLGSNTFNVGTIPAHGEVTVGTTVFPSSVTSGTTQNAQIQISYGNAYGYQLSSSFLTGMVIAPDSTSSTLNISYDSQGASPVLTAGKLEDLNFKVTNNGTTTLSNIVISMTPPSGSVSIVGDSKWTIQNLNPGDSTHLSTKVIAATSAINTPISFAVTATYNSDGVAKSDSLNLGAYVVGDIAIKAYDFSVNFVGTSPSIVGSLLNQGSTTGLYTSIELLNPEKIVSPIQNNGSRYGDRGQTFAPGVSVTGFTQGGGGENPSQNNRAGNFAQGGASQLSSTSESTISSAPQYIGDLTANSPTPFSIPLSGTIRPGTYPVSFKVVYADDLKHFHESIINGTINVDQPTITGNNVRHGSGFGIGGNMFFFLPITAASAVAGTFIVMKKRHSSKNSIQKTKKEIDIDSLLDDSSTSDKK